MATQRVVFSLVVSSFAIAVAALQGTASAQDNRGTMEQQMACTPDVWRLCGAQIPDVDRIVACLRANTAQLSAPCRAVFTPDNSPPPPPQRTARTRGRANQPRQQYDDAYQSRPNYESRPSYEAPPQQRPRYEDEE
jgi:hypothetical protein